MVGGYELPGKAGFANSETAISLSINVTCFFSVCTVMSSVMLRRGESHGQLIRRTGLGCCTVQVPNLLFRCSSNRGSVILIPPHTDPSVWARATTTLRSRRHVVDALWEQPLDAPGESIVCAGKPREQIHQAHQETYWPAGRKNSF
jgi:hypothetical protein